jgi:hypothetical protein
MTTTRPYLEAVAAIRRLDDAVAWLPEDLSIGMDHFADAEVLRPEDDPQEAFDYLTALVQETGRFRAPSDLAPPVPLSNALHDRIVEGSLRAEFVVTADLVKFLRDRPERRERWRAMLEAGAPLFVVAGPLPCNLWTFDDRVLIKESGPGALNEAYGIPIESENDVVRSWANDLIDRWRADATGLDADRFLNGPAMQGTDLAEE